MGRRSRSVLVWTFSVLLSRFEDGFLGDEEDPFPFPDGGRGFQANATSGKGGRRHGGVDLHAC